jgi:hypothetical protein
VIADPRFGQFWVAALDYLAGGHGEADGVSANSTSGAKTL